MDKKIAELKKLALAATPQNFDSAQQKTEDGWIECPHCSGEGSVELTADYLNYDGAAIGVQFYGIGIEHGAAEAYYRAAKPGTIIDLIAHIDSQASAIDSLTEELALTRAEVDSMKSDAEEAAAILTLRTSEYHAADELVVAMRPAVGGHPETLPGDVLLGAIKSVCATGRIALTYETQDQEVRPTNIAHSLARAIIAAARPPEAPVHQMDARAVSWAIHRNGGFIEHTTDAQKADEAAHVELGEPVAEVRDGGLSGPAIAALVRWERLPDGMKLYAEPQPSAQPAPSLCARSHPREEMSAECAKKTVEARRGAHPAPVGDERAAFEAWMVEAGHHAGGAYWSQGEERMYLAWQASAALHRPAASVPKGGDK